MPEPGGAASLRRLRFKLTYWPWMLSTQLSFLSKSGQLSTNISLVFDKQEDKKNSVWASIMPELCPHSVRALFFSTGDLAAGQWT